MFRVEERKGRQYICSARKIYAAAMMRRRRAGGMHVWNATLEWPDLHGMMSAGAQGCGFTVTVVCFMMAAMLTRARRPLQTRKFRPTLVRLRLPMMEAVLFWKGAASLLPVALIVMHGKESLASIERRDARRLDAIRIVPEHDNSRSCDGF